MWRISLLSRLRQMPFSKGRATSNNATIGYPEKQHSGPMSDRQLAVAIRQFRRSPCKNDGPYTRQSTEEGRTRSNGERRTNRA